MTPFRFARLVLALSCAASGIAHAGDVYKCTVQGKTVYQDTPCRGGADAKPHAKVGAFDSAGRVRVATSDVKSLSLSAIHAEMMALAAQGRSLEAEQQRDFDTLKRKLAGSTDEQRNRTEIDRVYARWQPQLQAVRARSDALGAELGRRCPGGAQLSAGKQHCGTHPR